MNIGFDLDKVFINNPPFIPSTIIEKLYREKENGELKYRLPYRIEQYIRIFSHYHIFRPPIAENITYLNNLVKNNKHNYFLISSRFGFLEKRTEAVLKRYRLQNKFKELIFNYTNKQPHVFKNDMIKKLHIDVYIDDDLPLVKFLAKENPTVKFFWLNKNKTGKLQNTITAIQNLPEAF